MKRMRRREFREEEAARLISRQMDRQRARISVARRGGVPRSALRLPVPGFGERPMRLRDFNEACDREGIVVLRFSLPAKLGGACMSIRGVPTIWIDKALRGRERVRVSFHELCHFLMRHGGSGFDLLDESRRAYLESRTEVEARAASVVALTPKCDPAGKRPKGIPPEDWRAFRQVAAEGGAR